MPRCLDELIKKAGGLISKEEAAGVFDAIERRYKRLESALNPDNVMRQQEMLDGIIPKEYKRATPDEFLAMSPQERMSEMAKAELYSMQAEKKEALRRRLLQVERLSNKRFERAENRALTGRNSTESIIDSLTGNPQGRGKIQSFEAKVKGIAASLMGRLYPHMEAFEQFLGYKMDEAAEAKLADALYGKPSGEKVIDDFAEEVSKVFYITRTRKNNGGADIGKLDRYAGPQSWSRVKTATYGLTKGEVLRMVASSGNVYQALRNKAKSAWVEAMLPRMDRKAGRYVDEATGEFYNDQQMKSFLENAWETIATDGLNKAPEGPTKGKALASRLGQHRELFFKDGASFIAANREIGSTDLLSGIMNSVHQSAKEIALIEEWGPNPNAGFTTALAEAKYEDSQSGLFPDRKAYTAQLIWGEINGAHSTKTTAHNFHSRIRSNNRAWLTGVMLTRAYLSQVNDFVTFAAIAAKDGLGMGDAIRTVGELYNPANANDRASAKRMGFVMGLVGQETVARYADTLTGDTFPSRLARTTMKLTGMEYHTNAMKTAYQVLFSQHVAMAKNTKWENLESSFKLALERNGFDAPMWDTLRTTEVSELGGHQLIPPSALSGDIAEKYLGLLENESDVAVLSPGWKERAMSKGGTNAGSFTGEFVRDTLLFRMYSIGMMTKILPRVFADYKNARYSRTQVAAMFALGNIMAGAVAFQLKELAKGRNPRDITTPAFWGQATLQSGGLGVFGDFLTSGSKSYGGGFAETVAGPVAREVGDALRLTVGNMQEAASGEPTHLGAEAVNMVKQYAAPVPWYATVAMDQLLWYRLQEAVNPGYVKRMQRRVENQYNTTYWASPSKGTLDIDPSQIIGGAR